VQFQKAKQAKDLDGLEQGFDAAAKIYERAVMLNTNDADAVFNLKFSKNAAEYIRQIKAALLRAKSSADTAVRRAEFHAAFGIMQELTQKYKIAGKQFEEFTKKLKDIDDIATPPRLGASLRARRFRPDAAAFTFAARSGLRALPHRVSAAHRRAEDERAACARR
jgi:hypothetical protein